ncbi:DUF4393 domain-containing protein [Providencia manganoxydans]|uniref:DUF4393 domain-containing protein n=1 Tax=Providencia manganoxydans TaxID=2923283 RepID=UPI0029C01843|nr:DUF4393 domain-containing protein [Providencia manganoxydans]MDX4947151.1 DUF4393 domain-containing protein [Providencia manganoxydans]
MVESNDKKSSNNGQSLVNLAVDLAKSVPLDENSKNIAGHELGKTVVTLTKAINLVLSPLAGTVYGYEKIHDFVIKTLQGKLNKVPKENVIPPKGNIVGPALESLKFLDDTQNDMLLKNMYANLIASAINKDKEESVHPAFVEVINQLDSKDISLLEAFRKQTSIPFIRIYSRSAPDSLGQSILLRYLFHKEIRSQIEHFSLNSSIDNLERLKLITVYSEHYYTDDTLYDEMRTCETYTSAQMTLGQRFVESKGMVEITAFGTKFLHSCTD